MTFAGAGAGRWAPAAVGLTVLLGVAPAYALEGRVADPGGRPLEGAKVCYFVEGREIYCATTDREGRFTLPDSGLPEIRIRAQGFLPRRLPTHKVEGEIRLARAAALVARVRSAATGEAVPRGRLFVVYASGGREGPFPFNAAGVRVRTLEPGEVIVRVEAEGFEPTDRGPVRLVAGETLDLVLDVAPAESSEGPADP